ncbi:response regulator [Pelagibius marinus]|uniref:response regulator n=1 Tax=Pelagibius marinus TaxID=2762760 RepID=UPI0018724F81|nr:response regulator [Pelagibius marinus]
MTERQLLMCDDEPEIGAFVRRIAEDLGYRMHFTSRADDFGALYREIRPDVVILDLVMPGIDGIELLHFLAAEQCRARILLMSGFNPKMLEAAQLLGEAHALEMVGVVSKPVRVSELRALLQDIRSS